MDDVSEYVPLLLLEDLSRKSQWRGVSLRKGQTRSYFDEKKDQSFLLLWVLLKEV